MSANLKDEGGNNLTNQPVTSVANPGAIALPNATTDTNGDITVTGTVPAPGTYTVTCSFAGVTGQYDSSTGTSNSVTATVKTALSVTVTVQ